MDGSSESRYGRFEQARGTNWYDADPNLRFVLEGWLDPATLAWIDEPLGRLGERCATAIVDRADTVDRIGHELETHDRFGRVTGRVLYHPDWLANLDEVFDFGIVGWNPDPARLREFGRAPLELRVAFDYLVGQADMALACPLEMSHGATVVLERFADDDLRDDLLPRVTATNARARAQVAQSLTELHAGSDAGQIATLGTPDGAGWRVSGEKWFVSNVGADLIFMAARVDGQGPGTRGLGMFVLERERDDGTPNGLTVRRLKDKMGTIGVPTGELVITDAHARVIGAPDRGWQYMAEMLNHTRFWNAVGSLGIMRRAYMEAAVHAARRRAFGRPLDALPMVRERLVWLTVDLEATTALTFWAANAAERAAATVFRGLAPLLKYRCGEQNLTFAHAAIETLGGNGYVDTFGTPRLLRDAQVNTIWEGTSNICALDVWRAVEQDRADDALVREASARLAAVSAAELEQLVSHARAALDAVVTASDRLRRATRAHREQHARRFADLLGDALALTALVCEADRGDARKAVVAHLFAQRLIAGARALDDVTGAFEEAADAYPLVLGAG